MKRNIIQIIGVVLLAFGITSCHDILDQEPFSTIDPNAFYKNASEAQLALNSVYSDIASTDTYGGLLSMVFTNGTDESLYTRTNSGWTIALYTHNSSTIQIEQAWKRLYKGINGANHFIEQIGDANSEIDSDVKAKLLAEAHFLRAFYYFDLVRLWGEVPVRTKPISDLADDINNVAKSSIAEVYELIVSDLTFAYENLPLPVDADYGHATKTAAHGLLARVYLTMAGKPLENKDAYQLAVNHCDSVINKNYHELLPDYKEIFLNEIQDRNNDKEVIFEIQFGNLRDQGIREDGQIGNLNGVQILAPAFDANGQPNPYSYAFFHPSISLINRYDDVNDERYAWNIANWKIDKKGKVVILKGEEDKDKDKKATWFPGKFRRAEITEEGGKYTWEKLEVGNITKGFTGINFPYLRYSDILLMKAEALNELDKTADAIPYLDMVRNRAGLGNIDPATVTTKESFFTEIMDERMREFCFEGMRKNDLVRWGKLLDNMKLLKQEMLAQGVSAKSHLHRHADNIQEKHNLLPIPLKEVTLNQLLKQNTLWE